VSVLSLDLASFASIRACADDILERFEHLDVLMNNAGAIISERRTTEEGFELTFGANHLGPFLLTTLLLDRLLASAPARIVNTASLGHRFATGGMSWADLNHEHGRYNGAAVYGESKLANVLFTMALAERLEGTGVTATSCHPGSVRTEFAGDGDTKGLERIGTAIGRPFLLSPEQGSRVLTHLASSPDVEGITGAYFAGGYQVLFTAPSQHTPSKAGRDLVAARRLWDESEKMIASVSA
jgi:NAD(P)-dependent dehydrogenase (short-subunit alcohol dehydrogenase family)